MKELNKTQLTMVSGAGAQEFLATLDELKNLGANWEKSSYYNDMISIASDVANGVSSIAKYILDGKGLYDSLSNTFSKFSNFFKKS